MLEFKILKKSKKSKARVGILKTEHGLVETPTLVPVATQGTVKALTNEEVLGTKTQILIANTYHLHLKPGEDIVKKGGGLHKFMNWQAPLMTDSGGFQVFSLGFGQDYGMGKLLKEKSDAEVVIGQQPKLLKITPDGVWFRSIVDGRKIFMGPKESMKIQETLGADIIFAFDECTPPIADHEYTKKSLLKTHRWAEICLKEKKNKKQALFGIVQGGKFKDLRIESAKFIGSLPFDGFGIGGEFGDDKKIMEKMIGWVNSELPEEKPRHLLGIGHPEDIIPIIKAGVDTFDCTAPTHYARRGIAFTSKGRVDLRKSAFAKDQKPVDKNCDCPVCRDYTRSYIHHLLKAREITPLRLLSFHNLYFFNSFIEKVREDIKNGKI
ncbi:MAG: tRNA guanosine(34) transglycosylase Tgt [Candidatus Pacebacteria bacterium]|nr:tRNA guanosine(34) transglycosylase Tgt [Candidatus Paceibacterota bacterium]